MFIYMNVRDIDVCTWLSPVKFIYNKGNVLIYITSNFDSEKS